LANSKEEEQEKLSAYQVKVKSKKSIWQVKHQEYNSRKEDLVQDWPLFVFFQYHGRDPAEKEE